MAELNFNALIPEGPRGFYQGFDRGVDQRIARDTNQFKLEEAKRDRDEALQLQAKLKSMGQDPDLNKYFDALINTGKPEYVSMAIEGKQKLKDLDAYAKLGQPSLAMPTGAPAMSPAAEMPMGAPAMPQAPAPINNLGALAPSQTAPVNALAPQPNADQALRAQKRIDELLAFARTNPRMAPQAMAEAKLLQDQLELFSKRGPTEPPEYATMRLLGYPLTQVGYAAFKEAQRPERPDRLLTPEEEKQRIRIANASRPPGQPRAEQPPVAVVDTVTGKPVYVSREQAMGMTPASAMESLSPKEIQKREAALPQATSSVKSIESKSDQFIKELKKLRDDEGLDQITGPVYGRTPSVSRAGSRAQSTYDKIFAKGGFQALQDMREASKTGGALGNVSNEEGRRLEKSIVGGLDRTQNIADVKQGINDLIDEILVAKARVREAYDSTYSYKSGGGGNAVPAAVTNPQFPGFSIGK